MYDPSVRHSTAEPDYSPHSLLPAPEPRTYNPDPDFFYHNVAKHLIKDTVRLMGNGLHIDLDRVEELEATLDGQLAQVHADIAVNPLIIEFLKEQHKGLISEYIDDKRSKMRTIDHYLKPFKHSDMVHRSYFMHLFAQQQGIPIPSDTLSGSTISKWPTNLVKTFASTRPVLQRLIDGTLVHPLIDQAMQLLAQHKCDLYNDKYLSAIAKPDVSFPVFNPNSSLQKQAFFDFYDIESDKTSKKTGLPSWERGEIERVNKETADADLQAFTQSLIDFSFAAIVRQNFIEAFYKYTINDRLYGQYKLLGAKTGRYTSNSPNMLNTPSSKSRFAKPLKRCFTAPEGFVIAAIDYSALEDRVIANLTGDVNKTILQTDTSLDGHLFHAAIYFRKQFVEILGDLPHRELAIAAKVALDAGDKDIKKYRDLSKNVTFGASYGSYPPKIASTIKCSLEQATEIFNAYHNDMYPSITEYRENYVLPTTLERGRIHLGLGFYIHSDDPKRDIRTLHNATAQMWSLLTVLTINKLHHLIDDAGLQNDILVTSSIYDSIYLEVRNDPTIIQWLNDRIIPIMTTDFMENQAVPNDAQLELGLDWSDLHGIPHNATLDDITSVLETL